MVLYNLPPPAHERDDHQRSHLVNRSPAGQRWRRTPEGRAEKGKRNMWWVKHKEHYEPMPEAV